MQRRFTLKALTAAVALAGAGASFSSRAISGRHEPQFVPALTAAPTVGAEFAPPAIASRMVSRPTPKQAHTIGPRADAAPGEIGRAHV